MNIPNMKRRLASATQKPFTTYLILSMVFHLLLIAGLAVSTRWLHKPKHYKPTAHTVSLIDTPSTLQQTSPAKQGETADKKPDSGDPQPSPQPAESDQQTKTSKQVQAPAKRTVQPTQDKPAPNTKKPTRSTTPRADRTAKARVPTDTRPTTSTLKPSVPTAKTKRQKETRPSPPSRTPATMTKTDQARQQAAEQRLTALRSRYGRYGESTTGTETTESLQYVRLRAYQELVREQIVNAWVLPLLQDAARNLQATALLTIDRTGHITQLEILETSNNPLFDESLIRAIRQAAPLPALPEDYHGAYLELELHFKPDAA